MMQKFFHLNLMALRIYNSYKLNMYMLLLLFICIISSIIFRSPAAINLLPVLYPLILMFTIIYSIKLISDLIIRIIQVYLINDKTDNEASHNDVKSIIKYYYTQNLLFTLLSLWILYLIFSRSPHTDITIYLLIIYFGMLTSIYLICSFPNLLTFNKITQCGAQEYSLLFYSLILFFILFYIFLFPLCIIKIMNSESFINLINKYNNDLLKNCYCLMDSNAARNGDNRNINRIDTGNNIIRTTVSNEGGITENSIVTSNNLIEVENRVTTNQFNINSLQINNSIRPSASTSALPTGNASHPSLSSTILDEVERLQSTRNVSSRTNLLENYGENRNRTRFNVNNLRKIRSVMDIKHKF